MKPWVGFRVRVTFSGRGGWPGALLSLRSCRFRASRCSGQGPGRPSRACRGCTSPPSQSPSRPTTGLHLDLVAPGDQRAKLAWLSSLDALVPGEQLRGADWIVLTDPEGNEFCRRAVRLPPACNGPGWPLLPASAGRRPDQPDMSDRLQRRHPLIAVHIGGYLRTGADQRGLRSVGRFRARCRAERRLGA